MLSCLFQWSALKFEPLPCRCVRAGGIFHYLFDTPGHPSVQINEGMRRRFGNCDIRSCIMSTVVADPARAAATAASEHDAKLAQKLGQLQPFAASFPQECMGQLAYFGPT
jgi:hypothetical protein